VEQSTGNSKNLFRLVPSMASSAGGMVVTIIMEGVR
jgi:hypothetical protein